MSLTTLKKANNSSRDMLHGYQDRIVEFIIDVPFCACFVDMGLGKSISTLTAVSDLVRSLDASRVLVIAPKRVAQITWPDEIAKWDHVRHLDYTVIKGTPAQRMAQLQDGVTIHIINRELVPWLVEAWKSHWPYDTAIIDESSSFKSHRSKRWRAMRKVRKYLDRVVLLTGTPAPNGLLDLWPQMYLLDRGERLHKTLTKFRQTWFTEDYWGHTYHPRPGADKEIHERIDDICLSMTADDYLELPEKLENPVLVDMPAKAWKVYREMEEDFLVAIGDEPITAPHAAAKVNKLIQIACGGLYDEEGEAHFIHDAKLDALADILEDNPSENILVAYNYQFDQERILDRFKEAVPVDAPGAIKRWNNGEIRMLIGHPASMGHGLNIQYGGSTIVWMGLNWSLELYQQFNARLHRQGQNKPVIIHQIVARDSVELDVADRLAGKHKNQAALMEAVKARIE